MKPMVLNFICILEERKLFKPYFKGNIWILELSERIKVG